MIRVVLLGRTANNLFQYALGRVLAERHGVPLRLDASWFNAEGWRQVSCLRSLPLRATVVRRLPLAARLLRKVAGRHYWEFRGVPVVREAALDHSFDQRLLDSPSDCVLFGYFQSPRYFAALEGPLRAEIDCAGLGIETLWPALAAELRRPGAVAVHVRRGDFTTQPAFAVCTAGYYRQAIERLRARVPAARFHVFSDDPAWCREHLHGPDVVVPDQPAADANPLHSLHLMSLASHHVIANSSYSWWAAWLGRKEDQIVLCPPRWFARDIHAPIAEKLCPEWEVVGEEGPHGRADPPRSADFPAAGGPRANRETESP